MQRAHPVAVNHVAFRLRVLINAAGRFDICNAAS